MEMSNTWAKKQTLPKVVSSSLGSLTANW